MYSVKYYTQKVTCIAFLPSIGDQQELIHKKAVLHDTNESNLMEP